MFLEHFGFREEPFGMTPDPAYLFSSRTHTEALAALSEGIADMRGFLALVAEPGMGKTTLLYHLSEQLRDTTRVVFLSQTQCNSREFIEYILQELGVDASGMGLVRMHGQLNEILFEELLAGKRFVLIVDEAQHLDDSVLETVRMLSNFETHNAKLLQIVLSGQPQLAAKLADPRFAQLRQRIAVLSRLEPLSEQETQLYIEHRMKVAGRAGEPVFDTGAIRRVAHESRGIPRNINNLCYSSLRLAHARALAAVTEEIVQSAALGLDVEALASGARRPVSSTEVTAPSDSVSVAAKAAAASASAAAAVAHPAPAAQSSPSPAPVAASPVATSQARTANAFLTYDPGRKKSDSPKWSSKSAAVALILFSGTLALAILGRSESRQGIGRSLFGKFSALRPGTASETHMAQYDAAPLETVDGQVLTVVAGPNQSLRDLCMRYAGHYDDTLVHQIAGLNPDLKDPEHPEEGKFIRIPLPAGAMRQVKDTADQDQPSGNDEPSQSPQ